MSTAVRFAERMSRLALKARSRCSQGAQARGRRQAHRPPRDRRARLCDSDNIVEAPIGAMQNGYTHYTPASGIFEAARRSPAL